MATYVEISDPDDPRLADYRHLRDVELRESIESEQGLFLAEGAKVVRRAAAAGFPVRSFLMAPRWLDGLADVMDASDAPCYVLAESLTEQVTGFHVHRGALGSFGRLPVPAAPELLASAHRILLLEDVNSPTNLGAIFRSAAGLGMDAVLLSPTCCDPLYRRAVRVSMGEVLAVPYAFLDAWPAVELIRAAGFRVLALTPADDAVAMQDVVIADDDRVAVLLGAEGPGLTAEALAASDLRVRIPMAAGVDSLNVGAAAAVACWALGRRS